MTRSSTSVPQGLDLSPTSNADLIYAAPRGDIAEIDPSTETDPFLRALKIDIRRAAGLADYPDSSRKPQSAAD